MPLLLACTVLPRATVTSYESHRRVNADLHSFQVDGRIAIRKSSEGFASGFTLQQQATQSQMTLTGPLGGIRARLTVAADGSTLELPDAAPLYGEQADALLRDSFGYAIPYAALPFWLRGMTQAAPSPRDIDAQGLPRSFSELNWHIEYFSWHWQAGLWLPEKMQITNDELSIKLSLHDWQF